jgi:hypothetical protein
MARNFDPTPKVCQGIGLVAKKGNLGHRPSCERTPVRSKRFGILATNEQKSPAASTFALHYDGPTF